MSTTLSRATSEDDSPGERRRPGLPTTLGIRFGNLALVRALPRGRSLSAAVWARRHRAVLILLWLHVPALGAFALLTGHGVVHAVAEPAPIAAAAFVASLDRLGRTLRSAVASLGIITSSAVLVHLSGGYIEAHFHFFVMVGVLALYQDWVPFLLAIGYVVVHHAVLGLLDPNSVFNHPAARANPALWAVIHGAFVLAASTVSLVAWRLVEHQSLHDPLTDLPNRALFTDRLANAFARAARHRGRIAVLFVDLDDFKSVNDRFGHAAGDEVLRVAASRIRASLRAGDTAGRLGGDEFALLVEDIRDPSDALAVANRLSRAMTEPIEIDAGQVEVAASVGIAYADGARATPEAVLQEADRAMYRAKDERATGGGFRGRAIKGVLAGTLHT